tara:strand:+ start:1224 stop:2123 length:900 start_codon:yes stop_codon:yes gene_type:complete
MIFKNIASAIVILTFTVFSYSETPADERKALKNDQINLMNNGNLCPKEFGNKYSHHIVLIDTTAPLNGSQVNLIKRLVLSDESLKLMKPMDKLSIIRLWDVAPSANKPIFSACRPRSGDPSSPYKIDKPNPWTETDTDLSGPFEKKFIGGVHEAMVQIADSSIVTADKGVISIGSPIMGQLKEIGRLPDLDFTNNSGYETRKLTIVSDLAQNTLRLPFYELCPSKKSCPSWEKFKKNKKYKIWAKNALPKFNKGIDVQILFLNENFDPQMNKGVLEFWYEFLEDSGITNIEFDNETSYK